jgi:hypothetical protein
MLHVMDLILAMLTSVFLIRLFRMHYILPVPVPVLLLPLLNHNRPSRNAN